MHGGSIFNNPNKYSNGHNLSESFAKSAQLPVAVLFETAATADKKWLSKGQ